VAPTRVEIVSLDHLVLTVRDVEATLAFYERIGFEPVSGATSSRSP